MIFVKNVTAKQSKDALLLTDLIVLLRYLTKQENSCDKFYKVV